MSAYDDKLAKLMQGVTYKPGLTLDVEIDFIEENAIVELFLIVRARYQGPCALHPERDIIVRQSSTASLESLDDPKEFYRVLRRAIASLEEHERVEWLRKDGERIFEEDCEHAHGQTDPTCVSECDCVPLKPSKTRQRLADAVRSWYLGRLGADRDEANDLRDYILSFSVEDFL